MRERKNMLPNEVIYQSVSFLLIWKWHVFSIWCTEMRFNSFLSNGCNTSTIVNPPDERRVNPTFVPCSLVQWIKSISDSTIQRQFFKEIANMVAPRLLIPPGSPILLDLLELMDLLDHPDHCRSRYNLISCLINSWSNYI